MLATIIANKSVIIAVLFGISEALGNIPSISANSVYQLLVKALSFAKSKLSTAAAPAASDAPKA